MMRYIGDFCMTVKILTCSYVGDSIGILVPDGNFENCHQHNMSLTLVAYIDVAYKKYCDDDLEH